MSEMKSAGADVNQVQITSLSHIQGQPLRAGAPHHRVLVGATGEEDPAVEGNLRATGQSKIEETLQVPAVQELVARLGNITERAGFEPAVG